MAEFLLPKNSKIGKGKVFKADKAGANIRTFKIYRYDPSDGGQPRWDSYQVDLDEWVGLVVLEPCIVAGLVLFNEIALEDERFLLGLRHDEFEVGRFTNHLANFSR